MRNFRQLNIWKDGIQLTTRIYKLSACLPKEERYGLRSQMTRAAVSIPANVAEGCSRSSNREFARFLEIAIGSSFELETHLLVASTLGFIQNSECEVFIQEINALQRRINTLITKVRKVPIRRYH